MDPFKASETWCSTKVDRDGKHKHKIKLSKICMYIIIYIMVYNMLINCIIKGKHVDGVDQDGNKHYGFCSEDCPKHVDVPKTNVRSQVRS